MKRACLYARVSSQKQADEKTINSQLNELRAYSKKQGFKVVKEYIDDGWSGEELERPGLDQLRTDAQRGGFDVVCCLSEDRIARDEDGVNAFLVEKELKKIEIEIVYLYEASKDPIIKGIRRLFAGYEKKLILERTRRGRMDRVRRGEMMGGAVTFGYKYMPTENNGLKGGKYVINKPEVEIVNFVFDTYLKTGSQRGTKRELEKNNVPTPKQGKRWSTGTIRRMLGNRTYISEYWYNKTKATEVPIRNSKKFLFEKTYKKRVRNGNRPRDKSEWVSIEVPEIIPKEKFQLVQEMLKKNAKEPVFRKSPYLLSGLIRCDLCGASYTGELCKGKEYYRCGDRHKKEPVGCQAKMVVAKDIENLVWKTVTKTLTNPVILIKYITRQANQAVSSERTLKEEQVSLLRKKKEIEDKKEKLLDDYLLNAFGKKAIRNRAERLIQTEKDVSQKLKIIELKLASATKKQSFLNNIKDFCKLVQKRAKAISPEEKQDLLRYMIDEIRYNHDTGAVKIIGYLPSFEAIQREKAPQLEKKPVSLSMVGVGAVAGSCMGRPAPAKHF